MADVMNAKRKKMAKFRKFEKDGHAAHARRATRQQAGTLPPSKSREVGLNGYDGTWRFEVFYKRTGTGSMEVHWGGEGGRGWGGGGWCFHV
jgi:hypothetical protein